MWFTLHTVPNTENRIGLELPNFAVSNDYFQNALKTKDLNDTIIALSNSLYELNSLVDLMRPGELRKRISNLASKHQPLIVKIMNTKNLDPFYCEFFAIYDEDRAILKQLTLNSSNFNRFNDWNEMRKNILTIDFEANIRNTTDCSKSSTEGSSNSSTQKPSSTEHTTTTPPPPIAYPITAYIPGKYMNNNSIIQWVTTLFE